MSYSVALIALAALAVLAMLGVGLARAIIVAQPDEWLLAIRNGQLVRAGIGISLWRRPGDVVARFTSTLQRVGFSADALSRERLRVSISGFILWSIAANGDGPFRAFHKLGLVNLDAPPRDLKSPKHLLSPAQHRAFQQLLAANLQRLAATRALDELLLGQEGLVTALRAQLAPLEQALGIAVEQVEIAQIRPADDELLAQLSAEVAQQVREAAATVQLESDARSQLRAIESDARVAAERRARAREQELAAEAQAMEVARAAQQRESLLLAARLDRVRREAEANRDAIMAVASAEEQKSQGARDHELARLVADRVGEALKHLPLREARWVTVGPQSPAASLAGLITAARELALPHSTGGAAAPPAATE